MKVDFTKIVVLASRLLHTAYSCVMECVAYTSEQLILGRIMLCHNDGIAQAKATVAMVPEITDLFWPQTNRTAAQNLIFDSY